MAADASSAVGRRSRFIATAAIEETLMAFAPVRVSAALLLTLLIWVGTCAAQNPPRYLSGTVQDALGRPIADAEVSLRTSAGTLLNHAATDRLGQFRLDAPKPGTYVLTVRRAGFSLANTNVAVQQTSLKSLLITMEASKALSLPLTAARTADQNGLSDTGANRYTMTSKDIANLPEGDATPLNDVMLQMPGAALDQNQEIHIRGEHMGIQYQMNGIMLPLDVNSDPTFTQLLNASFVQSVSLMDGVLPARYGYRTSGVIDIRTKDGCDDSRNDLTLLGGQRDTAQANFQIAGCRGKFSYYLSGMFLQSNLGFSSAVPAPDPIHDAVTQGQGFMYLTDALDADTKLSLISGMTLAFNQFPNQPGEAPLYSLDHIDPATHPSSRIDSGLNQQDYYGVLALNGSLGPSVEYQLAYGAHYNRETFYPDPVGDLIYEGIASNVFTSDFANSMQGDLTWHPGSTHILRGGFYLGEYGVESDQTSHVFPIVMSRPATAPISLTANLNKINLVYGVYVEDTWQIDDQLAVNFGARWDRVTGFTVDSQFSPTINFQYHPRAAIVMHAGFARNFQIPNFQNVASEPARNLAGTSGAADADLSARFAPFAETDYTWDTGFTHQFSSRLAFAQDNYFRIDRHYLDEGQFGFVPLDAPFNYVRGYGGGTENSLTYNGEHFSARINAFVAREEDRGVASGQYNFPAAETAYIDRHYIVLDHTPLVGASGGAAYRWGAYQFTLDGLFSSGLRGGFANRSQLPKVWQFNLSAARDFVAPGLGKLTNRITLLNIFDRTNLIRPANGIGVFQAAYGPRITVLDSMTISLPSFSGP
jgi:hypothetical protein